MRRVAIILAFMASIVALAGAPGGANAQGRVALVIGNGAFDRKVAEFAAR